MESFSPQVVSAAKLPILNPNEFDLWNMRIEQYFVMTDYSLWERLARKNKIKARGILLMALPDKHQLKFNIHKDAKTLMEAIKKRMQKLINQLEIIRESLSQEDINLKFLRSLPTEWRTHTLIWRNKTDLKEQSLDDFTTDPVSAVASVKILVSALPNVDTLSNAVIYLFFASQSNSTQLDNDDLKQIDADDLEEMDLKWNGATEPQRRNVPVETSTSNALVLQCDGVGSYDWSFQAEEEPTNYALMAFTSSSSSSFDNEVVSCLKACTKAYATLQSYYDKLIDDFRKSQLDVISYKTGLESVEARLLVYQQNKTIFKEDIKLLKLQVQLRDNALVIPRQKFKKAEQERDDLKLKLENDESLPPSPIYDRYQSGDGYHLVPPPYTGTFLPPKPDLIFHTAPNVNKTIHTAFNVELSLTKPDNYLSHTHRPLAPIIEDWVSDSEDASEAEIPQNAPSFFSLLDKPRPAKPIVTKPHSPPRRHINRSPSPKARNFPPKVTAVKVPQVNAAKGVQGKWEWKPKCPILDHVSCNTSASMTLKRFDYNDALGRSKSMCDKKNNVLFTDTECLILSPEFKLPDENQVLLRVPRENNMYNVDLKNIVPSRDLTCLFAKVILLEDYQQKFLKMITHVLLVRRASNIEPLVRPSLSVLSTNPYKELEDIAYSDDEEDVGAEADFTNLETSITVSHIPTTKVHKDHLVTQIIGDLSSATQTRSMTRVAKDQGGLSQINNDDLHTCMFVCFLSQEEPKRVHQALKDPSWIEAMQKELLQFKMQKVWVLVDLPHGKRAIGIKWVFRNNKDERGIVVRNKARLVAQGHTQEEGNYYEEVFAPVARIEAIRKMYMFVNLYDLKTLIILTRFTKWSRHYMGYIKLLELGMKLWAIIFWKMFSEGEDRSCIVYQTKKGAILLVLIYVDDIIFGSTNKDLCQAFKKLMKDKFQMISIGELTFFLALQVKQKQDGIFISHDKYVAEILRKFSLTDGKSASTLIHTEKPLLKDSDGKDVDVHTYRSMIGSLMYLTSSRPDIMFVVCVNDVTRLRALVDKKNVIITEATIRDALRLDDAESIDCLPNDEIFTELSRMGLVRNVDSFTKFYMYLRFLQLMIRAQVVDESATEVNVDDVPAAGVADEGVAEVNANVVLTTVVQPTPPPSPIAQPPSPQQPQSSQDAEILMDLLHTLLETCTTLTRRVEHLEQDKIAQSLEITKLKQRVKKLERRNKLKVSKLRKIEEDVDVTLRDVADIAKEVVVDAEIEESADVQGRQAESQAQIYQIDLEHTDKCATITVADTPIPAATITAAAPTLTIAPSVARRRKGVVIRDLKETATPSTIIHSKAKSKDKGKEILNDVIDQVQRKEKEDNAVMRYQALKRKPQTEAQARKNMMIYLRNMAGFKMDYFKGIKYDDIRLIFEKYFNSNVAFLEKTKEQMEAEDIKALKRISESQEDKAAKKQKLDEEVVELKRHLQITPNDEDDVYTEATPLACKVPVVDYEIYSENNKPYYKIIRADGSLQLFLSFLSLLRNFDREDLEMLWQLVKERFASSKPKNFADDFLLTTLTYMFEKPDVQAQMILLVERRYPLSRFTLDQMLNNVRLEVEEKSEVSLELLRFVRQQQQEGFRPE
nr:hypothetical protein [Tanacetum cinerariifolium]